MTHVSANEFIITLKEIHSDQDQDQKIDSDWSAPTRTANTTSIIGTTSDSDDSGSDFDGGLDTDEEIARLYNGVRPRCICCGPGALRVMPRPTTAPPISSTMRIAQSSITATLRPIPASGCGTTLLVFILHMHPAAGCRFINAIITWSFRPLDGASAPRVLGLAPQHSVGAWTPAQAGAIRRAAPGAEKMEAMRIEGSVRGGASRCVWTVEENASSRSGVPARLQLVAALAHGDADEVALELDVRGELGYESGSVPIGGTTVRMINVGTAPGSGEGRVKWNDFLKAVTGRVDPSVG